MQLEILGVRVNYRIFKEQHGAKFKYRTVAIVRPVYEVVLLQRFSNAFQLWQLTMRLSEGQCNSGWEMASFGLVDTKTLDLRGPFTHVPKECLSVSLDIQTCPSEYSCDAFSWSYDGQCKYYPNGHINFNMDLFQPTGRGYDKPLIWIFDGWSGVGKSTLAMSSQFATYETDQGSTLDDSILFAQIIVIGRRYRYYVNDIQAKFLQHQLNVEFVRADFGPTTL